RFLCSECFFFQAEDGIRDDLVTGVQTCALPISLVSPTAGAAWPRGRRRQGVTLPPITRHAPAEPAGSSDAVDHRHRYAAQDPAPAAYPGAFADCHTEFRGRVCSGPRTGALLPA